MKEERYVGVVFEGGVLNCLYRAPIGQNFLSHELQETPVYCVVVGRIGESEFRVLIFIVLANNFVMRYLR